jgi:hypothetical protein
VKAKPRQQCKNKHLTAFGGRSLFLKVTPILPSRQAEPSPRAIAVNIEIMRAFVRLRELIASNKALAAKLDQLEKKLTAHDDAITEIMHAIRQLMTPREPTKKR